MFWNLSTERLKTQSCVDKKSSFFHWGYSSKQWRIVPNWPLLGKKGFSVCQKDVAAISCCSKSQIQPSLECCSHIRGGAPKSSLHLLDKIQSKAIHLINNPNIIKSLQSLSHRHLVADLSISYGHVHGDCSLKIKTILLVQ